MAVKCSSRHPAESDIRNQQELPISQMESKWFTISENKRSMKMSLPAKVLTEGTAKQEMDNNGRKFSYIAQATGIGNQKLIPSCEKPQFIATPNSYSNRTERLNLENVPNNVAKVAEGKLPQPQQSPELNKYPRKKRRRRKSKHKVKISQKQSKTPEQESCPPIPVQENDAENSTSDFCSSTSSSSSGCCEHEQIHIRDSHGLCGLRLQNRMRDVEKIENMYLDIEHLSNRVKKSNVRPIPSSIMKNGSVSHNMTQNFERKLHMDITRMPKLNHVDVDGGQEKQERSFNNNAAMLYINDVGGDTGIRIPDSISAEETSPPQFSVFQCSASKGCVISDNLRCLTMPALQWEKYAQGWQQSEKPPETNEGVLQHEKLKPVDNHYQENLQWSICSKPLGVGTFGEVYVAKDHSTDFTCAAKRIHVSNFQPQELLNWSKLNSPRVVPLYGGVREGEMITLFMQLIQGGSVAQLIGNKGPLPEGVALYYTGYVLEALEHLHSLGIVHGDVKAENVLISHSGREAYLCDFGHSTQLTPKEKNTSNAGSQCLGTVTHMAPEVVEGNGFGVKVDSWSVACMMLHMLNGHHPRRNLSTQLLLQIVKLDPPVNEIPPTCSPLTANVIRAGLVKDPRKRATASELREAVNRALTSLRQRNRATPQSNHVQKVSCAAKSEDGHNKSVVTPVQVHHNAVSDTKKGWPPLRSETVSTAVDSNMHQPCLPKREPLNVNTVRPLTEKKSPQTYRRKPKNGIKLACNFDQLHLQDDDIHFPEATKPFSDEKVLSIPSPLMSLSCFQNNETEKKLVEEYGKLQKDFLLYNLSQVFPEQLEDHMLDVLSSDAYSIMDDYDKDSQKGMPSLSGNYSSGIHSMSWNSQTDGLSTSFSLSQRLDHQQDMPSLFNGVEARIHTFSGECLIVHDVRRATVGQVATGISNLIQVASYSLVKQNGYPISPDFEIPDSGIDLKCAPASNSSSSWTWRIKDGNLNFKS
ncbi:mitogen-activated protein kinase kinase kinase 14 isoform X1 [Leucoraja erinacea]|uniref:mitogen-activated protein kinase kinase kinase 14 isoform X1 n=1 Tax=Leucoraja erinaceus TaxID=7782 RepID=UPI002456FD56|nr:mitogen-activated protein kinase kinase kinase 14 isoform X1 [Leucoraja erinacea]XP_055512994.1 mitogen-activated protein kinase kinase kinase 14 isoform X1 [Leucoraja erinacea]